MTDTPPAEGKDPQTGRFLPGNRFWEARSSFGRKPKFETPDALWQACSEYFAWVEANPLYADNLVVYQGEAKHEPIAKMRAMTVSGLCIFLDISFQNWTEYRSRAAYSEITSRVDEIIRTQKFEGAAADLLNQNIIARELGLADKKEHSGGVAVVLTSDDANL